MSLSPCFLSPGPPPPLSVSSPLSPPLLSPSLSLSLPRSLFPSPSSSRQLDPRALRGNSSTHSYSPISTVISQPPISPPPRNPTQSKIGNSDSRHNTFRSLVNITHSSPIYFYFSPFSSASYFLLCTSRIEDSRKV